jgi:hypothetical protein
MKVIKLDKKNPDQLFLIKNFHGEDNFDAVDVVYRNRMRMPLPPVVNKYSEPPKIAALKYADLIFLCTGATPVIRSRANQQFCRDLPKE